MDHNLSDQRPTTEDFGELGVIVVSDLEGCFVATEIDVLDGFLFWTDNQGTLVRAWDGSGPTRDRPDRWARMSDVFGRRD